MPLVAMRESLRNSRDAVLAQFDAPAADLAKSYGPGKWTVHQILLHLADGEAVLLWRVCRAIAESGSTVEGFDQDAWVARLDYANRPLAPYKELFIYAVMEIVSY